MENPELLPPKFAVDTDVNMSHEKLKRGEFAQQTARVIFISSDIKFFLSYHPTSSFSNFKKLTAL